MIKGIKQCLVILWYLLLANTTFAFDRQDTLRGSNGPGRNWWDVQKYNLWVQFDFNNKCITGSNTIALKVTGTPHDSLQIDLQHPMVLDKVLYKGKEIPFVKDGNAWWVKHPFRTWKKGAAEQLTIYYHGTPRQAIHPPWDGGFSWEKDSEGKPWIAVSCQGLGASVWWPCKDQQWDEPDNGMNLMFSIPAMPGITVISNGKFLGDQPIASLQDSNHNEVPVTGTAQRLYHWQVKNPINNYDATFYIGNYTEWRDTMMGEKGLLDLDFFVLRSNEEKARKQFNVTKKMLHCFEYWLGPYPFYEDGFKLVDAPYLGMEHQGAIAYGNDYKMGYKGMDRTLTGIGLTFDYIIIHESAHEWFGNNVTARDIADMWVQEGITTYSECLFVECTQGKEKAQKYCKGEWHNIRNDKPIIGHYGVNEEGSGDMYDKGAAIMYMIRKMTDDDEKFRKMLRGLGKDFYHQTVTTQQVEAYIAKQTGLDLTTFFNQYLRTADVPQLEYYIKGDQLYYRFSNTVSGFTLPLTVTADDATQPIKPAANWQNIKWSGSSASFSSDFLIKAKKVNG
jgi:aminopeptidase N